MATNYIVKEAHLESPFDNVTERTEAILDTSCTNAISARRVLTNTIEDQNYVFFFFIG